MAESPKHSTPKPRLGRGLSSLISSLTGVADDAQYQPAAIPPGQEGKAPVPVAQGPSHDAAQGIGIDQISANPFQPRRDFPQQELADLSASIARHGILQPLLVTRSEPGAERPYVLIAGERRLRAAALAGRGAVPCVVCDATREEMIEWAMVENIHRSDLNPIERAEAYQQCLNRFGLTQADLAERLGEPRATIANYLRILELHNDVRAMLVSGTITFGHAKVLAGLVGRPETQVELARRVASESLSVRVLEEIVSTVGLGDGGARVGDLLPPRPKPAYIRDLEERLTAAVGTRVFIRPGRAKHTGRVVIEYYSLDDFDRLSLRLGVAPEA